MIMMYIIVSLIILVLILFIIGLIKKNKVLKIISKVIIAIIVVFVVGFISWSLYENEEQYKSQFEKSENPEDNNKKLAIQHYKRELESIPRELIVEDAVSRNYFVYDAVSDKTYNEDVLKKFVKNTEINAANRVSDEIIIVIYNINGDPSIYNLGYGFNEDIGYVLAKDSTRIDISKIEPIIDRINPLLDEYSKIVVNTNFPKEYYGIIVEDTGFSSNAIILKSYSNDYEDVEIARYMIDSKQQ